MSNFFEPTIDTTGITAGIKAQELQKLKIAISQYSPEYATDPTKINNLLASDPEGPEVALQKLGASMFYSKSLGYDPDYVYNNLETVGNLWGVQAKTPKEHYEWWTDNIEARIKGDEINKAYGELRSARADLSQIYDGRIAYGIDPIPPGYKRKNDSYPPDVTKQYILDKAKISLTKAEENLRNLEAAYTPPTATHGFDWALDTITSAAQGYISALISPQSIITAVLSGSPAGGVAAVFAEKQWNDSYKDAIDAGVPHDIANETSKYAAVLSGAVEFIQWGALTNSVKSGVGLKSAVTKAVNTGIKTTSKQVAAQTAKLLAINFTTDLATNVTEEVLQEGAAIIGQKIAEELAYLPEEDRITAQQIVDRLLETAKSSAVGMIPMSIIGAGGDTTGQYRKYAIPAKKAKDTINSLPTASPEVRQAITEAYMADGASAEAFIAKQETQPTAFSTEEGPENFYHASDEGTPVFYRSPESAAERLDGIVYAKPSEIVAAVEQKFGSAAGEWMQSVFNGKEVITEAAVKQLGQQAEALRGAVLGAQQNNFDFREMTDQQRATIESLGINRPGQDVVIAHLDIDKDRVWKGTEAQYQALTDKGDFDAWDTGDKVILKQGNTSSIIPIGAAKASSIRIPTKNGRVMLKATDTRISAVHPETGEEIDYAEVEPGPVQKITRLPERPAHARQLLQELRNQGIEYVLDVDQATRDSILESDPGYQKLQSQYERIEQQRRKLARSAMTPEQIDAAENQAENLDAQANTALEALGTYETDLLGEYKPAWMKTPEDVASAAQEVEQRNQETGQELSAAIKAAAPQLDAVTPALIKLMEIQANARGLSLADWRGRYLAKDAFTKIDYAGKRGAVQFFEDGKAMIALSKSSDPSTVIHELGHIVRRQLAPEDQAILLSAYKTKSWTTEAEELFAKDWETYFLQGKAPTQGLAAIFERIARFMKQVYRYIRGSIDPQVQAVIDRAMVKQEGESIQAATQADEMEFFQPSKYEQDLLSKEIDLGIKGVLNLGLDVHFGRTSDILKAAGLPDVEVVMPLGKLLDGMKAADKKHGHSLTKENYIQLQKDLYDPAYVIVSETIEGAYVVVSDSKDSNGDYIIASIKTAESRRNKANIITSVYGKNNLGRMVKSAFENNLLLYRGLKKEKTLLQTIGLQLPEVTSKVHKINYKTDWDILQEKNDILFQPAGDTNSPEFMAWFGDSKVVDAEGKPLVVYHGTKERNIEAFQPGFNRLSSEPGFFFSGNKQYSYMYGSTSIPVFLSIKNPLYVDMKGAPHQAGILGIYFNKAMQDGYDGIIIQNMLDMRNTEPQYVAFSPNQIKSVNNHGTWSNTDPRIMYQPEYTMPAETRGILERMDELKANYESAPADQQPAMMDEYRKLERAASSAVDLWLYELEKAFNAGESIPDTAIIEAANYATWAADELGFRRAMDFDQMDDMTTEQDPAEGDPVAPKTRKEYEAEFEAELTADPDAVLKRIRETMQMIGDLDAYLEAPDEIQQAQMVGMKSLLTGPLWIYVNAKDPTKASPGNSVTIRDTAIKSLKNNLSRGMEMNALAKGDIERVSSLAELERREPLAETAKSKGEAERDRAKKLPFEERVTRLREILKGPFHRASADQIEAAYKMASVELRRLTTEYKALTADKDATESRYSTLETVYQKTYTRLQEIAKELTTTKRQSATLDKNQTEEIEALRQRREQLKGEIRGLKESVQHYKKESAYRVRWTKAEAKQKIAETVQAMKDSQAKKETLRKAREYKQSLVKEILSKVPKSVDYTYGNQIRNLQALLDPRKRPIAQQRVQTYYEQTPEFTKYLIETMGELPDLNPVDKSYSVDQLEKILEQIISLEIEGKAKRLEYTEGQTKIVATTQGELMGKLEDEHDAAALKTAPDVNGNVINPAIRVYQATEEMQHIVDQLDGGALDYSGAFYKRLYKPMQDAASEMTKNINRRTLALKKIMAKYKVKQSELFHTLKVGSDRVDLKIEKTIGVRRKRVKQFEETLTINTAMGVYMASKNEQSMDAVTYGNKISIAQQAEIIAALPQKFKDMADAITEQIFDLDYDRLATIYNRVNNAEMGRVDKYYPMVRQQANSQSYEEEISWEAMARAGTKRTPKDGMTKSRVNIGDDKQTKIRLDAIGVTIQAIEKQERYIAFAELSKRVGRILNTKSDAGKPLTDAIEAVRPGTTRQITDWTARVVNRDDSRDEFTKGMLALKMNMSTFAMGFNLRSAINNVSGLALYMGESGPLNLLKSAVSVAKYNSMRKTMIKLAPEMDRRSIDMADQAGKSFKSLGELRLQGFRDAGFWLMKTIVNAMDTIGWTAVYNSKLAKGMNEQDAASEATAAVLRTQPTGDALAQSDMESNPWSAIITPFASQAYKIWNQLSHLPNHKKKGAIARYIQKAMGVAISTAMFVWTVPLAIAIAKAIAGHESDDDEKEDILSKFLTSFLLSNIPILGGALASKADGFATTGPFETPLKAVDAIRILLKDDSLTDEEKARMMNLIADSGFSATGLPWVQAKRIIKAIEAEDAEELDRIIHALVGGQL